MKELIEALGPWPMLQGIAVGMVIAAVCVWAILKGMRGTSSRESDLEEMRATWELRKQIDHIHANSFEMRDYLKRCAECLEKSNDLSSQLLMAINRFNDVRWNRSQ